MDSLLDLLALSLVLPLAVMFYLFTAQFSVDMDSSSTEFRIFTLELQHYLDGSDHVQVMRDGQGLRIHQAAAVYDIESYGTVVRKRKDQLGHEIMLTEIKGSAFRITDKTLSIRVEFQSGVIEEVEYALPSP